MTTAPDVSALIGSAVTQKKMKLRDDVTEPDWMFWELRNLNIHRVVGLARAMRQPDAPTLNEALRSAFARNFKRAWWRGIAYGVVANVGNTTFTPDDLKIVVDGRENSGGTMQWVVLLSGGDARHATGVHTWIEGFLSPVYRSVVQSLALRGYEVRSVMKDKDGLMKFLTGIADARARVLGGPPAFPEFRDPS